MYSCESCGKSYKFPGGLNNHKSKCVGSGAGAGASAGASAAAGSSTPLTSFKSTTNFTKEDLEQLEKRKQSLLNSINPPHQEVKNKNEAGSAAGVVNTTNTTNTNNISNVGNEEHNASFNIKYVKRSEETQEVVRSIVAAAHEYCKGRIIVTSDEPAPGGGPLTGISTNVNENGTTVYNHPTRTICIIETPPEEVSPEEEYDITLEKMTYLIISLIQNNNKLKKENHILRSIVAKIDPDSIE